VKIAQQLVPGDWRGQSKILYDYLRRFGFKHAGEKTMTELPGDSGGILRPPHQWQPASIGAIPFGQEMATNTLCMAVAYSALANRGLYQKPTIIKGYKTAENLFYPKTPEEAYRIVSEENTEKVIDMLIDVTEDPEGTGRNTRIPGYHIAAKTGTAQKMSPQGGGYGKGLRIGTFAGFFPAEDPQVAIVVMVDEPKKKKYGGEVAAPAWKAIAEEIIAYWGIPPSYTNDPLLAQQKLEKKSKTAEQAMKADMDKSRTFGVTRTLRITHENAPLITESTRMPNLVGMPIRDAYAILTQMGITATFSGSGKVVMQETPAGTIIQDRRKTGIILCEPMLTDPDVDTGSSMLAKG
jgi:cell division protein FtsI (penicillin-binding protein 3)